MSTTTVVRADASQRSLLERLWLMFRHDLSEFRGILPDAEGRFRSERLDAALNDPGWAVYVIEFDGRPVGFAIVRGLDGSQRVLSAFFVVRGARRTGIGIESVRRVLGYRVPSVAGPTPGRGALPSSMTIRSPSRSGAAWRRTSPAIDGRRHPDPFPVETTFRPMSGSSSRCERPAHTRIAPAAVRTAAAGRCRSRGRAATGRRSNRGRPASARPSRAGSRGCRDGASRR